MIVCHEPGCTEKKIASGWVYKVSKVRHFQEFIGPLFTHIVWLFSGHFENKRLVKLEL